MFRSEPCCHGPRRRLHRVAAELRRTVDLELTGDDMSRSDILLPVIDSACCAQLADQDATLVASAKGGGSVPTFLGGTGAR